MEAVEYDHMAEVEERHWWFRARLEIVQGLLSKHVRPGFGFDCSCGTGMTLSNLPQWVQIGADLNTIALAHSRARGLQSLFRGDLTRLPVNDKAFDLVTSLDTLEHIEDDATALSEIYRVLKPGGFVLMTVPAHPWMYSSHDRALHHVRRYRRDELREKVLGARFEIRVLRWINVLLFPPVALLRLISGDKYVAASDTDNVPPAPLNWLLYQAFAVERRLSWLPAPTGVSLVCLASRPARA
jgi:SAM-dependent methyltransferase